MDDSAAGSRGGQAVAMLVEEEEEDYKKNKMRKINQNMTLFAVRFGNSKVAGAPAHKHDPISQRLVALTDCQEKWFNNLVMRDFHSNVF